MKVTSFTPSKNENAELENLFDVGFVLRKPLFPFNELSIEFLSALSQKILTAKGIKNYSELVALAYWLRKSNITSIVDSFKREIHVNELIVPRGIAFHIAPSNVDSIFLYSWALSLLAGNLNIVRVSQNIGEQLELLLLLIKELCNIEKWEPISSRNIILTYPKNERINLFISSISDVRILWGGDDTVQNIKLIPSKPAAKDISFADKFSYTVINSMKYLSLNETGKINLSKHFFNDAYWFDQMACSSPRFVLFCGDEETCKSSSSLFWSFLEDELKRRGNNDTINIAMEKLVYMYESISRTEAIFPKIKPGQYKPTVLHVDKNEINKFRESCGGGFFFECFIGDLDELINLISKKDQTLSYSGFELNELKEFAQKVNGAGIDRIVPVGQALNFSPTWDGYSLLNELTKRVSLIG